MTESLDNLPDIRPRPEDSDRFTVARREYYKQLNRWCDSAEEEGKAIQQDIPELREMETAWEYLVGQQWKEAMPSYRAKPVSNEFMQMFWETVGLLTDIRPMFHIVDIANDGQYSNVQKILNNLAKGWSSTAQFECTTAFNVMFGMFTTSPCKLYWNPQARGYSGDPEDGDISMETLSPRAIVRLGPGDTIQEDECVLYRKTRTLDWIKRAFPIMGQYVQAQESHSKYTVDVQAPLGVEPKLFPSLSPSMKRLTGVGDKEQIESIFPRAEVQEFWRNDDSINETSKNIWMGPERSPWGYWVKPGKKMYPRGRLFIRANKVILWDQPSPYYHRRKPFAMLNMYGVPWQDYALSVVSPWMKQQDILNQIMAGVLQTVKKAVNPALMAPKSAINPAAMKAIDSSKPGLKVTYSQNSPTPPSWQKPPELPSWVFQTYGMILNSMKQSSGAAAVGDAMAKKQVPAGDSLEKISFAKNTPIRFMGRNLEHFLDDVGQLWAPCALQFYDASRRLELLGIAGLDKADMDDNPTSLIPDGIQSESFVRRYHFRTEKGSLLNAQQQEKTQMAFGLRKNHDLSRKQLFGVIRWNINQEENDQELAKEAEAMASAQAAAGKGKPGGKK